MKENEKVAVIETVSQKVIVGNHVNADRQWEIRAEAEVLGTAVDSLSTGRVTDPETGTIVAEFNCGSSERGLNLMTYDVEPAKMPGLMSEVVDFAAWARKLWSNGNGEQ